MRTVTRGALSFFGLSLLLSGDLMGEVAQPGAQGGIPPEVEPATRIERSNLSSVRL